MAITWPEDIPPSSFKFWLKPNTLLSRSPLNRAQQVTQREGATWIAEMGFETMDDIMAGRVEAILAQLEGSAGELLLCDQRRPVPNGSGGVWPGGSTTLAWPAGLSWPAGLAWSTTTPPTAPAVRVAAARHARAAETWGWAPGEMVLRAGDRIGLQGRLHMAVADVVTDAAGFATVPLMPPLREDLPAGTDIVINRPTARFRLPDNDQGANSVRPPVLTQISFQLEESLP